MYDVLLVATYVFFFVRAVVGNTKKHYKKREILEILPYHLHTYLSTPNQNHNTQQNKQKFKKKSRLKVENAACC